MTCTMLLLFLISLSTLAEGNDKCEYKAFSSAFIASVGTPELFESDVVGSTNHSSIAQSRCNLNESCKAVSINADTKRFMYYGWVEDTSLQYTEDEKSYVWMKVCSGDSDYKLIQVPDSLGYFEPVQQGSATSFLNTRTLTILKQSSSPLRQSSIGLKPTRKFHNVTIRHAGYTIKISEIPLPERIITEGYVKSWCTNGKCNISPRTYYHPVTSYFSIIGFTDKNGLGHVILLDQSQSSYKELTTSINGRAAAVAGVYGFHDKTFALTLFMDSENATKRKMYLRFYRKDFSVEWEVLLNSAISVPDRKVGDSRLSYGSSYFIVIFSVYGVDSFAEGTNGEQVTFVSDRGKVQTTSFQIPEQNFVKSGATWGCSHALGQLTGYHSIEKQFITVCSADLYPKGIAVGNSIPRAVVFRAEANGRGFTSAQLGQLAEANMGYKLVFNAENSKCCPSKGIGFITIYNEANERTGGQEFDPVTWLTSTNGSSERDPVIARTTMTANSYAKRETYLVGWYNQDEDKYMIGLVNTFGSYRRKPVSISELSLNVDSPLKCSGHCIMWGNRDDSLKTLSNGHVGWIYAPPNSRSIWHYDVLSGNNDTVGWSLWSTWSRCSRSCNVGRATRFRSCFSGNCEVPKESGSKKCNTHECKVPVTCAFNVLEGKRLDGDLFINGVRQYAFSIETAQEKCQEYQDLCSGISHTLSGGFYFYFLKSSVEIISDPQSTSMTMTCMETPGWAQWSTWSACSLSCEGGIQFRSRFCDGNAPGSEVCLGKTVENLPCNTGKCPTWSNWTDWSLCSRSCDHGFQNRSRICLGDYPDSCGVLTGPHHEERTCFLDHCPSWAVWAQWTSCSTTCGEGLQERTRECIGDFPCHSEGGIGDTESIYCFPGVCPYWSDWSHWSFCAHSCGDSARSRTRNCMGDYPSGDGCPLVDEPQENEPCNLGACPYWGEWGDWGECLATCGKGTRLRSRNCLGDFPLQFCPPGSKKEIEECNLGECAHWGKWMSWEECSTSCGSGTKTRTRECLGDFSCPKNEPNITNTTCHLGVCPGWKEWSLWGPCTVTCGFEGERIRTRECTGDFPSKCKKEDSSESDKCENASDCPRWTVWSEWNDCSRSCDVGTSHRLRSCAADSVESCNVDDDDPVEIPLPDNANFRVETNSLGQFEHREVRECLLGKCSYWLEWVTWQECSVTCGSGTRRRTRDCYGDFPYMCLNLGTSTENETCTKDRCRTWSIWQSWSQCSTTCGAGTRNRHRTCLGNLPDTCVGSSNETSPCDIRDCVIECSSRPCNNGGICRENEHLTRLYHCVCTPGWIGKHCDYPGPELVCGSDNIIVSFDRRMVSDEGLISTDPNLVRLAARHSPACTSFFDNYNGTDAYFLVVPSPVDISCGSIMEVSPTEYLVRNQVLWEVEDAGIRSKVILIDFACVYIRNVTISSATSSFGEIAVGSYKRNIQILTDNGLFEVDISLFRDVAYQQPILTGPASNSLISLAEGEVVFVSVNLQSKELLPFDAAALVMDTCFVTSTQISNEPLLYLLRDRCPVTPLVTVISNGESRSGRFSVRVFGWTGKSKKAENVFIHCTVSICEIRSNRCITECNSKKTKKSEAGEERTKDIVEDDTSNVQKRVLRNLINSQNPENSLTKIQSGVSHNGRSFTTIVQIIPPYENGEARVNLSTSIRNFSPKKMVSAGPLEVVLKIRSREAREIDSEKRKFHKTQAFEEATIIASFDLITSVQFLVLIVGMTILVKRFFQNVNIW